MTAACRVGEWWRERRAGVVHKVKDVPGSKGLIGEGVCGRYVGPQFNDSCEGTTQRAAKVRGKICQYCRAGRRLPWVKSKKQQAEAAA